MNEIRCYVDFNTMMQYSEDRVIVSEQERQRLGSFLQQGVKLTVFSEDLEAEGVAEWEADMKRWTVLIDKPSYRHLDE